MSARQSIPGNSPYEPAATMVEVSRLVDPTMLVEVEVEAIVREGGVRRDPWESQG